MAGQHTHRQFITDQFFACAWCYGLIKGSERRRALYISAEVWSNWWTLCHDWYITTLLPLRYRSCRWWVTVVPPKQTLRWVSCISLCQRLIPQEQLNRAEVIIYPKHLGCRASAKTPSTLNADNGAKCIEHLTAMIGFVCLSKPVSTNVLTPMRSFTSFHW